MTDEINTSRTKKDMKEAPPPPIISNINLQELPENINWNKTITEGNLGDDDELQNLSYSDIDCSSSCNIVSSIASVNRQQVIPSEKNVSSSTHSTTLGFIPEPAANGIVKGKQIHPIRKAIYKTGKLLEFSPKILSISHKRDWLRVDCALDTAEWFKSNIEHIQKLASQKVNIADKNILPSTIIIQGEFPNNSRIDKRKILALIQTHYPDLNVSMWKCFERKQDTMIFEVDTVSWCKLLYSGGNISCENKHINLKIKQQTLCSGVEVKPCRQKSGLRVRTIFSECHVDSSEKVLAVIKQQNQNLCVSQWIAEDRRPDDLYVTFDVDEYSWQRLQQANGFITYLQGQIA
ncbi:uncharacterized protein LOC131996267 [Stomoxys calcitrans]|uniref:uncharacterized protein LOC131996267 n=1 Tax=Stomoxys calcitrans TaxID=35570 RepID=UPI0027E32F3F|nr:uncharacterized protein LOC131996267 [Stomoxys calcitrans]XP_059221781.1 uncharacterized protein LOC131996267 [Stomoxys calcitrans]